VKGIYVAGVTEEYVTSHTELLDIMSIGTYVRVCVCVCVCVCKKVVHSSHSTLFFSVLCLFFFFTVFVLILLICC
jgi:hypothetical protein